MTLDGDTVRLLRTLLGRAEYEPYTIALLTDEELAAVERTEASTPHPSPWIAKTGGLDREIAARFGARSLLSRGLLRPADAAPGTALLLDLPAELRVVLDTRRVGLGYVRAVRPQDGAASSKIIVMQPELGAFEEDISVQGFHLFTACNYADSTSRMAHWCVPGTDHRPGGGVAHIAVSEWPAFLHAELPDARVTDLSIEVFLPDHNGVREPEHWLLASSDTVSLLARPASSGGLAVRPVGTERLRDLLDERVASACQYARGRRRP